MNKIKDLIKKLWHFAFYTEAGLYLVFGVLTTVVSLVTYYISELLIDNAIVSTVLKNVSGILFAYFTNRSMVFGSKAKGKGRLLEFLKFTASRLSTFALDLVLTWIFADRLSFNSYVVGTLTTVVVIILNYVLSKLFVFTKKH